MRRILPILLSLALALLVSNRGAAQSSPSAFAVQLSISIEESAPAITLHWKRDADAQHFYISRRVPGDQTWKSMKTSPGSDTAYRDNTIKIGAEYEYRVIDSSKALGGDSLFAAFG